MLRNDLFTRLATGSRGPGALRLRPRPTWRTFGDGLDSELEAGTPTVGDRAAMTAIRSSARGMTRDRIDEFARQSRPQSPRTLAHEASTDLAAPVLVQGGRLAAAVAAPKPSVTPASVAAEDASSAVDFESASTAPASEPSAEIDSIRKGAAPDLEGQQGPSLDTFAVVRPRAGVNRRRGSDPTRMASEPAPVPDVVVQIGRIEVRAAVVAAPRREPASRPRPRLSLDQYLNDRHGSAG